MSFNQGFQQAKRSSAAVTAIATLGLHVSAFALPATNPTVVAAGQQRAPVQTGSGVRTEFHRTAADAAPRCTVGDSRLDFRTGGSSLAGETIRVTTMPAANGVVPTVTAQTVNGKGTGAQDNRTASGAEACAQATTGANLPKADLSVERGTRRGYDAYAYLPRCTASADLSSVSIIGLPPAPSGKVSVQDIRFVSSANARAIAGGGPGVGPTVEAVCTGADGTPSALSMLLLPAVQR